MSNSIYFLLKIEKIQYDSKIIVKTIMEILLKPSDCLLKTNKKKFFCTKKIIIDSIEL